MPLVTRFAGKDNEGALKAKTETVQGAMNAIMADKGITPLTGRDKGTTSNGQDTWTALPRGAGAAVLAQHDEAINPGIDNRGGAGRSFRRRMQ